MSRPIVRFEEPGDFAAIREVNELAFGTTVEAHLVDRLRDSTDCISLVAAADALVIGHILFTPVDIAPSSGIRVAGLGPMAVRPQFQRGGVGGQLIRAGLEACRERGYSAVVVVGHPTYYPRFGFEPAHEWGLTLRDFDVPPDVFMAIELEPDIRGRLRGAVGYRPEFADT